MKKLVELMVLCIVLALAGPGLAQPGGGMGGGGGGPGMMGQGGGMGARLYDPQTVATVKGRVEKLEDLPSMGRGAGRGMQYRGVVLRTDQGSLLVHLGPAWYLDEQKFAVKDGDTLEVTGSKVTLNNQPALIAREVTTQGQTLKLRDDQGLPLWRGMGGGGGMGQGSGAGPSGGPGSRQGKGPGGM